MRGRLAPPPRGRLTLAVLATVVLVPVACSQSGHRPASSRSPQAGAGRSPTPAPVPSSGATRSVLPPHGTATGAAVTINFAGDTNFESQVAGRLAADPATALRPIAASLAQADLTVVNLETAITTRGTPAAKQFVFRAPASALTALRAAGVDVATQANNHGMDYGLVGLQDSLAAAAAARFPVVGIGLDDTSAYRPFVATVRGQRIALIGATQVIDDTLITAWTAGAGKPGLASAKTVPQLLAAVRAARAAADTLVVYLHWGQELVGCPTDRQRTLARQLVDAGADIVVGSHAHVLLGAGYLGRSYVDYGLGNFLFYSAGGLTGHSGVLRLTVRGRAVTQSTWRPAQVVGGVPQPLSGSVAAAAVASWDRLRECTDLSATPTG